MSIQRLVTDGRYVFAAAKRIDASRNQFELVTFDSSGPGPLTEIDAVPFESEIVDLQYSNKHVYALADGLHIIDVMDPRHPRRVGKLDWLIPSVTSPKHPAPIALSRIDGGKELAIAGSLAAIRVSEGIEVVDIADASNPLWVGRVSAHSGDSASGIAMLDHRAYIVDGGLRVVDFSDPALPRESVTIDVPEPARVSQSIAIDPHTHLLYVVNIGLFVFDIADPTTPHLVWSGRSSNELSIVIGALLGRPAFKTIRLGNGIAYVVTQEGWLSPRMLSFDITDPMKPQRLPRTLVKDISPNFASVGNDVYVTQSSNKPGCWSTLKHLRMNLYPMSSR